MKQDNLGMCPVCQTPVFEIGEGEFGCDSCKRVWVYHDGMWVSKARKVRIIKEPKVGDKPSDFLEPLEDDENET